MDAAGPENETMLNRKTIEIDLSKADADLAFQACLLLRDAYDKGRANGAHIDMSDINVAVKRASEAIPGAAKAVRKAMAEVLSGSDYVDIEVAEPEGTVPEIVACLRLLHANRTPGGPEWSELDHAWETAVDAVRDSGILFVRLYWEDADEEKALAACEALCEAFDNGKARGASMDWNDVERAVGMALDAIPGSREAMEAARAACNDVDSEVEYHSVQPRWEGGKGLSDATWACLKMIYSARNFDETEWEDVEDAWVVAKKAVRKAARQAARTAGPGM